MIAKCKVKNANILNPLQVVGNNKIDKSSRGFSDSSRFFIYYEASSRRNI